MGLCMSYDQLIQFKEIEIKQHDQKKNENINSNTLSNISFVVETLEVNALVLKCKYSDSEEITKMILVSY